MPDPRIRDVTACRVCGSPVLVPYLDLGQQAPANALRRADERGTPEFTASLTVLWCPSCHLSQLSVVVDPDLLYADYPFRAGVSSLWRDHCEALAESLDLSGGAGASFVLDIGANDGTLLEACARRGARVLGVDPCPANPDVPMLAEGWSSALVPGLIARHGYPDVITATNVFGHVDDARDFLAGIAALLPPQGQALIECPHILPFLEHTTFDTIYHEHLSYWSLRPLEELAAQVGLRVTEVELFEELHGGTMRYTLVSMDTPPPIGRSVRGLRILEQGLAVQGLQPYQDFAERSRQHMQAFRESLEEAGSRRVCGYGASAKGNVLLQAAHITPALLPTIVDDSSEKWGLYTPGTGIPIQPPSHFAETDLLVLLSWNNAPALKAKARAAGFRGRFLVPHPDPHFEDAA